MHSLPLEVTSAMAVAFMEVSGDQPIVIPGIDGLANFQRTAYNSVISVRAYRLLQESHSADYV
jgi:hypothetical protein